MYRCRYFGFTCFHWLKCSWVSWWACYYPYADTLLPFVDSVCWSTATANSKDERLLLREKWQSHILILSWPAQLHHFYGNCWKAAHPWSCPDEAAAQGFSCSSALQCSARCGGDVLFSKHAAVPECWGEQVHWALWQCCFFKSDDSRKWYTVLPRRFWHTQCISIFQEVQQQLSMWCPVLLHVHKYVWCVMKVMDLLCIPQIF